VVVGATVVVVVVGSAAAGSGISVEEQAAAGSEKITTIAVTADMWFTRAPSGVDPGDSLPRPVACHPQGRR